MTRLFTLSIALAAALSGSASAADDTAWTGECGHTLVGDRSGALGGGFSGTLDARFALYSPAGVPVSATVTCTLLVFDDAGGWTTHSATFAGTTVVVGSAPLTLPGDTDPWDVFTCVRVDVTSDDTPTYDECFAKTTEQIPPQEVHDGVDATLALVPGTRDALCAGLRAAGPAGVFYGVSVGSNGDVHVGHRDVFEC